MRPVRTAVSTASCATHGSSDIRMRSAPDASTRTAVSPTPNSRRTASMLSASVTMRSSKPRSSRRRPVVTFSEREAGTDASGSSSGRARCPVITLPMPPSSTCRNGTSSSESSRARSKRSTGSAMCESTSVSPCPGKCLTVAMVPPARAPSAKAEAMVPTSAGVSPNDRMLMIGFSGLLLTSATGA